MHTPEEWQANHQQIWRKLDQMSIILPPGAASRLRKLVTRAGPGSATLTNEMHEMRKRIRVILESRSWKLTTALRKVRRLLGGGPEPTRELDRLGHEELQRMVAGLERSTSWRITQPIRTIKRRLRRNG